MRPTALVLAAIVAASATAPAAAVEPRQATEIRQLDSLERSWIGESHDDEECSDGVRRDDGSFENGYRIALASDVRYVQRLTPPSYPSRLDRICVAFAATEAPESMPVNLIVYDDNGAGGSPGSFLGFKPATVVAGTPFVHEWTNAACSDLDIEVESGGIYVGAQWNAEAEIRFFLSADESFATPVASMYQSSSSGSTWGPVTSHSSDARALGIRAQFSESGGAPPPPATGAISSPEFPGYRFWVRINDVRTGTPLGDCIPDTVCVAGAIPTRAEVFLRVAGPKPNGYLWTYVVKFNTTKVEVWVRQLGTGETNYYSFPALGENTDVLPGLVDRTSFLPD
jgi:hypothetical protein